MSQNRPLALAVTIALAIGAIAPMSADAQQRRAAPKAKAKAAAVAPVCNDFYHAINQSWLDAAQAPQGIAMSSQMGLLRARAEQQQRDLLDSAMAAPQNAAQGLLGAFWASGLDEAAVEVDGSNPIAPLIARINGIRRAKDVPASLAALHQVGIPVAYNFSADVDLDHLQRHIGYFTQGGIALPDPGFYTRNSADSQALMTRYRAYVAKVLTLTGTQPKQLDAQVQQVIDLETRLASASSPLNALRDPRANYRPTPVAGLDAQYRNLQLQEFLKAQGVNSEQVSIANPAYLQNVDELVRTLKPDQWKTYLRYQVGNAMAPYLSRGFRNAHFEFFGQVIQGKTTPDPRWKQVLDAINIAAGPMLGQEYTARYVPADVLTRAQQIGVQIRDAQGRALDRAMWMSPEAKAEAKAKLASLGIEVGRPQRDLDYTIQPMGRGSFGSNILIASTWRHREEMRRIGQENAGRRWNVLPQDPSIAYDIAQNRIIVTAAALQPPIIDGSPDIATHLGSLGTLIGHEMSHAFDAAGRMVDARGAFRDWWTAGDQTAWETKRSRVGVQYGNLIYPFISNTRVNGSLVRDHALADLAGMELAQDALHAAFPGSNTTQQQTFYKGWAQLWPQKMGPEAAAFYATTSPEAPGIWRTNAVLANQSGFAAAYKCKVPGPMALAEEARVKVW